MRDYGMNARDAMPCAIVAATLDRPIGDVAQILHDHGISAVPVVGKTGLPIGIVSAGDLDRRR